MNLIVNRKHIILFILSFLIINAFSKSVASEFFVYFVGKEEKQLNKIDVYSKFVSPVLKTSDYIFGYHFSPDSRYILISTRSEVYILNRDTEKVKLIDFLKDGICLNTGWSPDSKQFYYYFLNFPGDNILWLGNIDGERKLIHKGRICEWRIFFSPKGEKLYFFENYKVENPEDPMKNLKIRFLRVNILDNLERTILEENIEWGDVWLQDEVIKRLGIGRFNEKEFFSTQPAYWSRKSFSEKGGTIWVEGGDRVLYKDPEGKISKQLFVLPRDWLKGIPASCDVRWLPDDRYALISFSNKIFIFDCTTLKTRKIADGKGCGWYGGK